MSETALERHYRKTLEWVGKYAGRRRHSLHCEYIEKVIITELKRGQKIAGHKKSIPKEA